MAYEGLRESIDAHNKDLVYQDTWGHLAPMKNKTYRGTITCAKSFYNSGTTHIIDIDFDELPDSPWLYEAVDDLLFKMDDELKEGFAYVIKTTFRNYRFWTKVKEVKLN